MPRPELCCMCRDAAQACEHCTRNRDIYDAATADIERAILAVLERYDASLVTVGQWAQKRGDDAGMLARAIEAALTACRKGRE